MSQLRLIFAVAIIGLGSAFAICAQPDDATIFRGKLSELAPSPSVLGKDWMNATGLVVEDFSDLETHPTAVRPLVAGLKDLMQPIGINKVADFSFRVPDQPWRYVTLRVFVFDTPKSCSQWWEKKYRYEGWEKYYKLVEGKSYKAVDSKEAPKRAAAIGNVWMTCHALKDTGDHIAIMDACIEKVLKATKPK
jgi:hypothetical protein